MTHFPSIETTSIILIDMQEKLLPVISGSFHNIISRQQLILNAARELKIPALITEQYTKGLGRTVSSLSDQFQPQWPIYEKTSFSCFGSVEFRSKLESMPFKSIALMGIETHVCVQQTAFDAVERGFHVFLIEDTVGSRNENDHKTSLNLQRSAGVSITSSESFLFMLLRDSIHPSFKNISKMLK